MKVVFSGFMAPHRVVVEDEPEKAGYRVIEGDGLFNPSEEVACFIESLVVGARPWVSYVYRRKGSDELDFETANRFALSTSRIIRVTPR